MKQINKTNMIETFMRNYKPAKKIKDQSMTREEYNITFIRLGETPPPISDETLATLSKYDVHNSTNDNLTNDELMDEIAILEQKNNRSNLRKLHDRIMILADYDKNAVKHILEPLTRQEWFEVFRLAGYSLPELSDHVLQELNLIHKTSYYSTLQEAMSTAQI